VKGWTTPGWLVYNIYEEEEEEEDEQEDAPPLSKVSPHLPIE
jgi:hypothetical protein